MHGKTTAYTLIFSSSFGSCQQNFQTRLAIKQSSLKIPSTKEIYPITKVEDLHSYKPHIQVDEGMAISEQWLREEGYLNNH